MSAAVKLGMVASLWLLVCLFSWNFNVSHDALNNFRIFTGVYHHVVAQSNLYAAYPLEYGDTNHYGPLFSVVIAPFAHMPIEISSLLWVLLNGTLLAMAVCSLPISNNQKWLLLLLCSVEFANTTHSSQSNCLMTALMIFAFVLVNKHRDEWATALILLGAFIKLYPVMALVFFVFSKRKPAFIVSAVAWTLIFFCLPMLLSSKHFIIQSYFDWFDSLVNKNASNRDLATCANYSVIGVIDGIRQNNLTPNSLVITCGLILFCLPLLRFSQYTFARFRLYLLASVLIFVVIFSTSAEHPTYIIAVSGVFLWLVQQPDIFSHKRWLVFLVIFLTGIAPTDALPAYLRDHFVDPLGMKAWPCIIAWVMVVRHLVIVDFSKEWSTALASESTGFSPVEAERFQPSLVTISSRNGQENAHSERENAL